ncbi:MAG: putative molybdenum carrier protein [Planctomycetes bacterium]|nr:putative molybdenum carrier protein [Planctomycetota bacterium]
MYYVRRIVSGGQTGVDRAALDAAIALGIDHGGWSPRGRRAEDGVIDSRYRLRETDSTKYHVRTEWNVRDSDGTLILHRGELSGGTDYTRRCAALHGKPCLSVALATANLRDIRTWLADNAIAVLNVAGPRESTAPGIYEEALALLEALLLSAVASGRAQADAVAAICGNRSNCHPRFLKRSS